MATKGGGYVVVYNLFILNYVWEDVAQEKI